MNDALRDSHVEAAEAHRQAMVAHERAAAALDSGDLNTALELANAAVRATDSVYGSTGDLISRHNQLRRPPASATREEEGEDVETADEKAEKTSNEPTLTSSTPATPPAGGGHMPPGSTPSGAPRSATKP